MNEKCIPLSIKRSLLSHLARKNGTRHGFKKEFSKRKLMGSIKISSIEQIKLGNLNLVLAELRTMEKANGCQKFGKIQNFTGKIGRILQYLIRCKLAIQIFLGV